MIRTIRSNLLAIIILFFLGVSVYSNTLNSSFHFDDFSFILENPLIRTPEKLIDLFKYWPSRFLGFLSFAVNYQIHQFSVFGYHLVNILLHILTSFLVFWFVSLTFSSPAMRGKQAYRHRVLISFFAAAIFLTHPVQTETLNYVFQRVTILAAIFYLTALCLYAKAMLSLEGGGRINPFYYSASLIAAFTGMFTKENIVTLPLMMLLYHVYFFQEAKGPKWKYALPFLLLLPVVPLTVAIAKPVIFMDVERLMDSPWISSSRYLWTQLSVLLTYLRLFLFPIGQSIEYDYPLAQAFWGIPTLASFLALAFIIITGILTFFRHRLASFGIFWFFLTLLPESSIIPIRDPIYEHRLYLPLVGCSILAVYALHYLFRNKNLKIVTVILSAIVITCSFLTYKRNRIWENEIVLWSDAINKSPGKVRPYNNRGTVYSDQGEYDKAIIDFSRAIELNRNSADGYYNRGLAYQRKGEYGKAVCDYTRAVMINPKYLKAHINRGLVYSTNKEYEKAAFDFKRAMEIAPFDTMACSHLAYLYITLGKKDEALVYYKKILEIDPKDAPAYYNLGVIYADKGSGKEALEFFKKALEADPRYTPAFAKLVQFYSGQKDKGQLMALYEKAIANKLDDFDAYYNTGNLYSSIGKNKDAIVLYRRAVEINPGSAKAYAALGSSYCLLGDNKMAVLSLKKAVQLNPNLGAAHNNLAVVYYYNKNYDLAIRHCDRAIQLGYKVNSRLLQLLKQHENSDFKTR